MPAGAQNVRWAFKCAEWSPTKDQWMLACRSIQTEEKDRIAQFVFKKDAKSAMSGRLLMRKLVHDQLKVPYNQIKLGRTEKGKPFLTNQVPTEFKQYTFNVSHQGTYAVLAGEPNLMVGVDVMQIVKPSHKSLDDYFDTFKRQFTTQEWNHIRGPSVETEQLKRFFRTWCLKEAYVKAIGVGIGFQLNRLDFHIKSDTSPGTTVSDTKVFVDGEETSDWHIQETMLDDTHCLATALHSKGENLQGIKASPFETLSIEDLLKPCQPITIVEEAVWENFNKREELPR